MKHILCLALAILSLTIGLKAQNIDFKIPDQVSICDTIRVVVALKSSNSTLSAGELTIDLPCGHTYIKGSVNGAQDVISSAQQPKFSTKAIGANKVDSISFKVAIGCAAFNCIETKTVFNITSKYKSGATNLSKTSNPYNVNTGFLVFTNIANPYTVAESKDIFERTLTIKNTRKGRIKSFIFTDRYDGNLKITANLGSSSSISGIFSVELGPKDFKTIGNGDAFFDFNEEINLIEKVLIEDCVLSPRIVLSTMDLAWGCNGTCQSSIAYATIKVNPITDLGPKFIIIPVRTDPYCIPGKSLQRLDITELKHNDILENFTIDVQSPALTQDILVSSIVIPPKSKVEYGLVKTNACGESVVKNFKVIFDPMQAKQNSVNHFVTWQVSRCEDITCGNRQTFWTYEFDFKSDCSRDENIYNSGLRKLGDTLSPIVNFTHSIPVVLPLPDLAFSVHKVLVACDHFSRTGTLRMEFIYPLKMVIGQTDYKLGDKLPSFVELKPLANGTQQLILEYPLPFNASQAMMEIPFQVSCGSIDPNLPCIEIPFSDCKSPCGSVSNPDIIKGLAYVINPNEPCPIENKVRNCITANLKTTCIESSICLDTLPGYLDFNFEFRRVSIDRVDTDGDGIIETFIPSPTSINNPTYFFNDTFDVVFNGSVGTDIEGSTFKYLTINEAYNAYASNDPITRELLKKLLVSPADAVKVISTDIIIKDASTQIQYKVNVPIDTFINNVKIYNLSASHLRKYNPNIPSNFVFEKGDEFSYKERRWIDSSLFISNPILTKFNAGLIYNNNIRGHLSNIKPVTIDTTSICNCINYTMGFNTFNLNYPGATSLIYDNDDICPRTELKNFAMILKIGYTMEYFQDPRPKVRLKGLRIFDLPDFEYKELDVFYSQTKILIPAEKGPNFTYFDFTKYIPVEGYFPNSTMRITTTKDLISPCLNRFDKHTFPFEILIEKYDQARYYYTDTVRGVISDKYQLPLLKLEPQQKRITSLNGKLTTAFTIKETSEYEHDVNDLFVRFITPPEITNLRLFDNVFGNEIIPTNGIYNIGTLEDGSIPKFAFSSNSVSCGTEMIIIQYGYNCGPWTDPAIEPCILLSDTIYVDFPQGLVDMDTDDNAAVVPLCGEYEQKVEIFNAGLGSVYDMSLDFSLPQGMKIVPNSAYINYPKGSTNKFNIDDPTVNAQGKYVWDFSKVWLFHKVNGLIGTSEAPKNTFDLFYKTITDCDFIAGIPIVYTVTANRLCGKPTNTVSKVTNNFNVINTNPPYSINVKASNDISRNCANDTMFLSIVMPSSIEPTALVNVEVSPTWTLINTSGNLQNLTPTISNGFYKWSAITSSDSLRLRLTFVGKNIGKCTQERINIFGSIPVESTCITTGEKCDIDIVTGQQIFNLSTPESNFEIATFEGELDGSLMTFNMNVNRVSVGTIDRIDGAIFIDNNTNGIFDVGDKLLADNITFSGYSQNITSIQRLITIDNIKPSDLCRLVFWIPSATNCLCDDEYKYLKTGATITTSPIQVCTSQDIAIGVTNQGASYQWNTNQNLSCTQCPQSIFSAINPGPNVARYERILTETVDSTCKVVYVFNIEVNPTPSILTDDVDICVGDTLKVLASLASTYDWSGQNITLDSQQILKALPTQSGLYSVVITNAAGCVGRDTFMVNILQAPDVSYTYDSIFCIGRSAMLNVTTDPGTTFTWVNGSNRLSNSSILNPLIVVPENFTYIIEVSNGICRKQVSLPVKFDFLGVVNGLADDYKICLGDTISGSLEFGYAYTFAPANNVKCLNPECSKFEIIASSPLQSFTVESSASDGCKGRKSFDVIGLESSSTTNTDHQICQGDSISINGRWFDKAQSFCDTFQSNGACIFIDCHTITLRSSNSLLQDQKICRGDSVFFDGNVITEPGQYFTSRQGVNGQCDTLITFNLGFYDEAIIENIPLKYDVVAGEPTLLQGPPGFARYFWSPPDGLSCDTCQSPIFTGEFDTTYTLTVVTENGCIGRTKIVIDATILCELNAQFKLVNAFTPNDDGINDIYTIPYKGECGALHLKVYNRWGNVVFEQSPWDNRWDGRSNNGEALPQGTYYAILTIEATSAEIFYFIDLRRE